MHLCIEFYFKMKLVVYLIMNTKSLNVQLSECPNFGHPVQKRLINTFCYQQADDSGVSAHGCNGEGW